MTPFTIMRDQLRTSAVQFVHLDAAQLVKHAFGLATEGRRIGKAPVLLYLYAEPARRGHLPISADSLKRHRQEIAEFAAMVAGAEVHFAACSYREWFTVWGDQTVRHADALIERYHP